MRIIGKIDTDNIENISELTYYLNELNCSIYALVDNDNRIRYIIVREDKKGNKEFLSINDNVVNYYQILGINQDATKEEIEKAYLEKLKEIKEGNPDKYYEDFHILDIAYQTLSNLKNRHYHDRILKTFPEIGNWKPLKDYRDEEITYIVSIDKTNDNKYRIIFHGYHYNTIISTLESLTTKSNKRK